jgi:predicted SAM-dependent methyltransferase
MIEVFKEKPAVMLDLGGGDNPAPGFESVDLYAATASYKVNLFKFPWPWADNSVSEIHCAHFVEHIPMVFVKTVEAVDMYGPATCQVESHLGGEGFRDLWCAFFDECHRILRPGGKMTVITPHVQSVRAFQDPTHRRFHSEANFLYLDKNWREANKLTHYLGSCHFDVRADRIGPMEEQFRHPEAQMLRSMHYWNAVYDLRVTLIKPEEKKNG